MKKETTRRPSRCTKTSDGSIRTDICLAGLVMLLISQPGFAEGEVTFEDIAAGGEAGLVYSRVPSATEFIWEQYREGGELHLQESALLPLKSRGAPGVAIFDFDDDGDLDIYVTNGPAADNSLFANQLVENGLLSFVDVAAAAGVGAPDQDSSGVCYGDIDNDGDEDLLVLGVNGPNRLFENNGDGTFTDNSATSGLGDSVRNSASCSFGDVNNDGLLDVVVANCCQDVRNMLAIFVEPFALNEYNQLFLNTGGNTFVDVSETSGILDLQGFSTLGFEGSPTITWAIAMVDYDLDGDVDIFLADDQGGMTQGSLGGIDRGILHLLENDGTGSFTDVTVSSNLNKFGQWMGLSFGDINADGHLDFFVTNVGDWAQTIVSPLDPVYANFLPYELGNAASRWFLGGNDGVFADPGVGSVVATPFGWGTSMADYDNDADTDIIFHGGLLPGPMVQTAPGVILRNDGTGEFSRDADALAGSTDHELRTVHGMAMGDLNGDGFSDIISVSNFDIPESAPLARYNHNWGSPFDGGYYSQQFTPTGVPFESVYSGVVYSNGTLSVEISSGDNGNGWLQVELLGTAGIVEGGRVNRDGIGAVVQNTTADGKRAMQPVLGGASYASQDSLRLTFGLGSAPRGQVEVLWPGAVRNRLYNVRDGDRILFPVIPCSYDGEWQNFFEYKTCVKDALNELVAAGFLSPQKKGRFFVSAVLAYFDARF